MSHNEGNTGTTSYVFTVTKTGATELSATVYYSRRQHTTTLRDCSSDVCSSDLTFAPNVTTQTITVLVNGDVTFETDEAFTVHLSNASGEIGRASCRERV